MPPYRARNVFPLIPQPFRAGLNNAALRAGAFLVPGPFALFSLVV
jgi:hypothetical protein